MITWDEELEPLLGPSRAVIDGALGRLAHAPVHLRLADGEGSTNISPELLAGVAGDPLDRWRRAVARALEAACEAAECQRPGWAAAPAWLRAGLVLHQVDRAVPELGVAEAEVALARRSGDLAAHPRAGVAVLRAWDVDGRGVERGRAALERVRAAEWIEAVRWILGSGSDTPDPIDVPARLGPWSFAPVEVAPHPRGGRVRVRGGGGVSPAWARGGQQLQGVAGAMGAGCALIAESGGPTGSWKLASAGSFEWVFGARGVAFTFKTTGRLEVVFADAFLGSAKQVDIARTMGASGTARGRWSVAGPHLLGLHDIVPMGVTVHGRDASPDFKLPADGMGMVNAVRDMAGSTWRWRIDGDRLTLYGAMYGGPVEVRLTRESA